MIDYTSLGFKDAKEFSNYHFDKFTEEQKAVLKSIGITGDEK